MENLLNKYETNLCIPEYNSAGSVSSRQLVSSGSTMGLKFSLCPSSSSHLELGYCANQVWRVQCEASVLLHPITVILFPTGYVLNMQATFISWWSRELESLLPIDKLDSDLGCIFKASTHVSDKLRCATVKRSFENNTKFRCRCLIRCVNKAVWGKIFVNCTLKYWPAS